MAFNKVSKAWNEETATDFSNYVRDKLTSIEKLKSKCYPFYQPLQIESYVCIQSGIFLYYVKIQWV